MDNKLFIKGENGEFYEGPLSDKPTKLLFVMKEPNGDKLNCFWMKDVVDNINNERREIGLKYYNVLGAFAKSISNVNSHKEAWEQSAYINLYPFDGKSKAVSNPETCKSYIDLINAINEWESTTELDTAEPIDKTSTKSQILCNRLKIIEVALENDISVAVHFEIADMIINHSVLSKYLKNENVINAKHHIASFQYKDKKAKLYVIPHPTNRRLKYSELEKILNTTIYP